MILEQGQGQAAWLGGGLGGQARQRGQDGGQDEADGGDQEVVAAPAAGRREDTGGGSRRREGWGTGVLGMGCTHSGEPSRMRAVSRPLRRLRFGDGLGPARPSLSRLSRRAPPRTAVGWAGEHRPRPGGPARHRLRRAGGARRGGAAGGHRAAAVARGAAPPLARGSSCIYIEHSGRKKD